MNKFIHIDIEDKFKAEVGLVLTGRIDVEYYGEIECGNYLEFNFNQKILRREIIGVDYFRIPHYLDYDEVKTRTVGLLIKCEDNEELIKILNVKSLRDTAKIYKD